MQQHSFYLNKLNWQTQVWLPQSQGQRRDLPAPTCCVPPSLPPLPCGLNLLALIPSEGGGIYVNELQLQKPDDLYLFVPANTNSNGRLSFFTHAFRFSCSSSSSCWSYLPLKWQLESGDFPTSPRLEKQARQTHGTWIRNIQNKLQSSGLQSSVTSVFASLFAGGEWHHILLQADLQHLPEQQRPSTQRDSACYPNWGEDTSDSGWWIRGFW